MPLCFAYGSNLDTAAMQARCPASRVVGPARLKRHRLIISADGYATVLRDPRSEVLGLLYDIAAADMAALDRYEAVGQGLYRKILQSVVTPGGPRRAIVYVGRSSEPGRPRPGYLEGVVAAAAALGFPAGYLAALRALGDLPRAHPAAGPRLPA